MILFLIIIAYPLYFILIASISDPTLIYNGEVLFFPKGITFLGYEKIFQDEKILIGYRNTIMYTLVGTLINVALTVTGGYALSRKDMKGRRFILRIFTFAMFFNGGMIPTYLLVKNLGMLYTFWAMVIPNAVSIFNIIIARTYYENNIHPELHEAAFIDGCGNLTFFHKIALPLSKSLTAVMVLFYAVGHWNSFFNALIYLNDQMMYPLQLILRNILIVNQSMDNSMLNDVREMLEKQKAAELIKYGVIVVSSLPILILYPFIQKYFVKGVMIGAIKG
ncbi:MAG: carbohydrate ABC transporter permease [Clostridiaceae bacterium]|nr:carbohydrate ABC transporter permease [Clostridiaceae bacterium]